MKDISGTRRGENFIAPNQAGCSSLAYRLGKHAKYSQRFDAVVLTLGYPLKAVSLNAAWKPVLQILSQEDWVAMDQVAAVAPVDYDATVGFLDGLAAKGYFQTRGTRSLPDYPSVSIIIPVHNRPEDIDRCLQSIAQLDYPKSKLETIVVDDASSDHTPNVVSRRDAKLLVMSKNRGASFCRNRGAEAAKGELLAFVDSDCLVSSGWLLELVPAFQNQAVAILGGSIDGYYQASSLDKYEQVKSSLRVGNRLRRSDADDKSFYVPSCNMLVRKAEFLGSGGFDEGLRVGEDVDLCWRMQDTGVVLEYRPKGSVFHKHRAKWKSFCRRRFDYGTSEPLLQMLHPNRPKRFPVFPGALLFWAGVAASLVLQTTLLALLPCMVWLGDGILKFCRIRRKHLPIGLGQVMMAVLGSYSAFAMHWCKFISRYYLLLALLLLITGVWVPLAILIAHIMAGLTEYFSCRPGTNLLAFLWWFTLEQLSYQAGVWWGCLRRIYFRPLVPKPYLTKGI